MVYFSPSRKVERKPSSALASQLLDTATFRGWGGWRHRFECAVSYLSNWAVAGLQKEVAGAPGCFKKLEEEKKRMNNPMFALIPFLPILAIGGGIGVILLLGWGLYWAFWKNHDYLLTGFSAAGKTTLVDALYDLWKYGKRRPTKQLLLPMPTLKAYSVKFRSRTFFRCTLHDDSGNLEAGRNTSYEVFVEKALINTKKYSIIYVVDLTAIDKTEAKRHIKSELSQLEDIVTKKKKEMNNSDKTNKNNEMNNSDKTNKNNEMNNSDKIEMIIVGSHYDLLDGTQKYEIPKQFRGMFTEYLNSDCFSPRYILADLISNEGSKRFANELFETKKYGEAL